MVSLSEKMERIVYNLLRSRELLMRNCKEFHIPTDWMLDSGILNKIKLGSVMLAKKFMRSCYRTSDQGNIRERFLNGLYATSRSQICFPCSSEKVISRYKVIIITSDCIYFLSARDANFDQFNYEWVNSDTMHEFEELRNVSLV